LYKKKYRVLATSSASSSHLAVFPFSALLPELVENIFSFCDRDLLCRILPFVCREYRDVCKNSLLLWRRIYENEMKQPLPADCESAEDVRRDMQSTIRNFRFGRWELHLNFTRSWIINTVNRRGAAFLLDSRDPTCCFVIQTTGSRHRLGPLDWGTVSGPFPDHTIPEALPTSPPPPPYSGEHRYGNYHVKLQTYAYVEYLVVWADNCPAFFILHGASNGWALARYKAQAEFNPFDVPPIDQRTKHGKTVWSGSFNLVAELWPEYPRSSAIGPTGESRQRKDGR